MIDIIRKVTYGLSWGTKWTNWPLKRKIKRKFIHFAYLIAIINNWLIINLLGNKVKLTGGPIGPLLPGRPGGPYKIKFYDID